MLFQLVDVHAHLEELTDLDLVLKRARMVGVVSVIAVGSDYKSNKWLLDFSKRWKVYPRVYPALGLHPWSVNPLKIDSTLKFILKNVDKAVGIGEIGLDYWYKNARKSQEKRDLQKKVFGRILEIARDHEKPAIIHSRGAWQDCLDMVEETGVEKAVFHWFSGPKKVLEGILRHGFFISATPAAEYSKDLQRTIQNTPLERILLETDSPVEYGGTSAEPADILKTLEAVANLKAIKMAVVAEKTTQNVTGLFDIDV